MWIIGQASRAAILLVATRSSALTTNVTDSEVWPAAWSVKFIPGGQRGLALPEKGSIGTQVEFKIRTWNLPLPFSVSRPGAR
jgi:hypothetical protein